MHLLAVMILAQALDPALLSELAYRTIGPDGNRTIAIAGEPGNNAVAYIGAASGGIWKTTDGGSSWLSIFDDVDVASVGSIAIAPSDPNVVWAGTGETFVIRPALAMGNGMYRSTDAGETWTHVGLEKTGRIGRLVVSPTSPSLARRVTSMRRKELLDLVERYGKREGMTTIVSNAEELSTYAVSVEGKLFDVNLTGAREDAFRAPMKLYGRLGALGNDVGHDSADFRPTDQQLEVHAILTKRLDEVREEYRKLTEEDVPAFRESFP